MKRTVLLAACCAAIAGHAAEPQVESATATFVDAEGRTLGSATLKDTPNGVLIEADLRNVPPGEHAFHIHEVGRCEPASDFKSAGDHHARSGEKHGYMPVDGPHAGDMPNQFVARDGVLRASEVNRDVSLRTLLDEDGSSLILHASPDDYASQPSGKAGDRIACAVVKRAEDESMRQAEAEE